MPTESAAALRPFLHFKHVFPEDAKGSADPSEIERCIPSSGLWATWLSPELTPLLDLPRAGREAGRLAVEGAPFPSLAVLLRALADPAFILLLIADASVGPSEVPMRTAVSALHAFLSGLLQGALEALPEPLTAAHLPLCLVLLPLHASLRIFEAGLEGAAPLPLPHTLRLLDWAQQLVSFLPCQDPAQPALLHLRLDLLQHAALQLEGGGVPCHLVMDVGSRAVELLRSAFPQGCLLHDLYFTSDVSFGPLKQQAYLAEDAKGIRFYKQPRSPWTPRPTSLLPISASSHLPAGLLDAPCALAGGLQEADPLAFSQSLLASPLAPSPLATAAYALSAFTAAMRCRPAEEGAVHDLRRHLALLFTSREREQAIVVSSTLCKGAAYNRAWAADWPLGSCALLLTLLMLPFRRPLPPDSLLKGSPLLQETVARLLLQAAHECFQAAEAAGTGASKPSALPKLSRTILAYIMGCRSPPFAGFSLEDLTPLVSSVLHLLPAAEHPAVTATVACWVALSGIGPSAPTALGFHRLHAALQPLLGHVSRLTKEGVGEIEWIGDLPLQQPPPRVLPALPASPCRLEAALLFLRLTVSRLATLATDLGPNLANLTKPPSPELAGLLSAVVVVAAVTASCRRSLEEGQVPELQSGFDFSSQKLSSLKSGLTRVLHIASCAAQGLVKAVTDASQVHQGTDEAPSEDVLTKGTVEEASGPPPNLIGGQATGRLAADEAALPEVLPDLPAALDSHGLPFLIPAGTDLPDPDFFTAALEPSAALPLEPRGAGEGPGLPSSSGQETSAARGAARGKGRVKKVPKSRAQEPTKVLRGLNDVDSVTLRQVAPLVPLIAMGRCALRLSSLLFPTATGTPHLPHSNEPPSTRPTSTGTKRGDRKLVEVTDAFERVDGSLTALLRVLEERNGMGPAARVLSMEVKMDGEEEEGEVKPCSPTPPDGMEDEVGAGQGQKRRRELFFQDLEPDDRVVMLPGGAGGSSEDEEEDGENGKGDVASCKRRRTLTKPSFQVLNYAREEPDEADRPIAEVVAAPAFRAMPMPALSSPRTDIAPPPLDTPGPSNGKVSALPAALAQAGLPEGARVSPYVLRFLRVRFSAEAPVDRILEALLPSAASDAGHTRAGKRARDGRNGSGKPSSDGRGGFWEGEEDEDEDEGKGEVDLIKSEETDAVRKRKKKRRPRRRPESDLDGVGEGELYHPFIDAFWEEESSGRSDDNYSDLEDFIVCKPGRNYSEYVGRRTQNRRKGMGPNNCKEVGSDENGSHGGEESDPDYQMVEEEAEPRSGHSESSESDSESE